MQLWRHTAHPGHPFTRFHTGNLDTLLHAPKVSQQALLVFQRLLLSLDSYKKASLMDSCVRGAVAT